MPKQKIIKKMLDDKIAAMQKLSAKVKALDAELAEIDVTLTEFTTITKYSSMIVYQ